MKPRLAGHRAPYDSTGAKDAFVDVLVKVRAVQDPGLLALSYTDPATELEQAVVVASLWCNEELLSRMTALKDAVLDQSRGEGSREAADRAREFFSSGCRQALGTDK